ncbi:hypothetical protein F2P79_025943, partial [Pimephales promelas]
LLDKRVGAYGWVAESSGYGEFVSYNGNIMNISYANYFPSAFLLLSRDACPRKMAFVRSSFCVQPLTGISDAPTPVMRRLNACDETTQRLRYVMAPFDS